MILDRHFATARNGYELHATYRVAERTVQVKIRATFYDHQSSATVSVLTPDMTWTQLAEEAPSGWHNGTFRSDESAAAETAINALADRLVRRATAILSHS